MMGPYAWAAVGIVALLALIALLTWRWFHRAGQEIQIGRARESFHLQRERLEQMFFQAAASSGKPRGLRWRQCEFGPTLELARDKHSGELIGLVPVTISFEAIAGSDMEGVAAVGNLRSASAVFVFRKGQWVTNGRAVMNLNPVEAIQHFHKHYEGIHEHVPGESGTS
ncbi:MAG TPA: hypothetical protein VGZ47_21565 [Gemmataceae bacterium]|jgi:hypothetical protein|nr:hypothetical protein [Gemmataceae bacterium]